MARPFDKSRRKSEYSRAKWMTGGVTSRKYRCARDSEAKQRSSIKRPRESRTVAEFIGGPGVLTPKDKDSRCQLRDLLTSEKVGRNCKTNINYSFKHWLPHQLHSFCLHKLYICVIIVPFFDVYFTRLYCCLL